MRTEIEKRFEGFREAAKSLDLSDSTYKTLIPRDTNEILDEIMSIEGESASEKIKEMLNDKPELAGKIKDSEKAKGLHEGGGIHDYMPFFDVFAEGLVAEAKAEEIDASAVVLNAQNPITGLNRIENSINNLENNALFVVLGAKVGDTNDRLYELHKVRLKIDELLKQNSDWEVAQSVDENARAPYEVNDQAWEKQLDRVFVLVRKDS